MNAVADGLRRERERQRKMMAATPDELWRWLDHANAQLERQADSSDTEAYHGTAARQRAIQTEINRRGLTR